MMFRRGLLSSVSCFSSLSSSSSSRLLLSSRPSSLLSPSSLSSPLSRLQSTTTEEENQEEETPKNDTTLKQTIAFPTTGDGYSLEEEVKLREGETTMITSSIVIPHPDKFEKGGEDAVVLSSLYVGLADGVGGWADSGINSGDYSRILMQNAGQKAKEILDTQRDNNTTSTNNIVPTIIDHAQKSTLMKGSSTATMVVLSPVEGSSTATMVVLSPVEGKPHFHIGNLGDSFTLILRPHPTSRVYQPLLKTSEQAHFFNCPFQLSEIPKEINSSQGNICDTADCGQYLMSEAKPGDLVVLGSDGVSDNLFIEQIVGYCQAALSSRGYDKENIIYDVNHVQETVGLIASRLARIAQQAGQRTESLSPFALGAQIHGMQYSGGKPDDISIVTGFVLPPSGK